MKKKTCTMDVKAKVTEKSCSGITLRSCSGHFQRPLNCCMVIFSGDKSNRAVR